jgi:hypothetical protein
MRHQGFFHRSLTVAVLVFLAVCCFGQANAQALPPPEINNQAVQHVKNDLQKLDAVIYDSGVQGQPTLSAANNNLTAREIYRAYVTKAEALRTDLVRVKTRMDESDWNLSLQQLGAMAQQVATRNTRFSREFKYGEDGFYSYKLIEKAARALDDAVSYWREANKYRLLYRGTAREQAEDDEVLRVKLQTALSAIEELDEFEHLQKSLQVLEEGHP